LKSKKSLSSFLILCFTLLCFNGLGFTENTPIYIPVPFPDLKFTNSLSIEDREYLGIQKKRTFSFKDIPGIFILVELTNTYCVSCKKNIKIFNEVYKKTRNNKEFKERIKIVGIAIGNNRREVEHFKNENAILYPIIIDPEFTVHEALGEPRVPYTMFTRKDAKGKAIIFKVHKGVFESAETLMNEIKIICSEDFERYCF